MSAETQYSFEHGIDHCGYDGIAPILAVGHKVTERDFIERDLSGIRGVSVSQDGLSRGTRWEDLNLNYLFGRLTGIEYLRIWFNDSINLNAIGRLPSLLQLHVDCPKVRGTLKGEMPHLRTAQVRWSDACTKALDAPNLEKLTLIRPRSDDLKIVGHLTSLTELHVHYSRSLCSLAGIERLESLESLGIHDCANVVNLDIDHEIAGPRHLLIAGCKRFLDTSGALQLKKLRTLSIYCGERGPHEVQLPSTLREREVEIDLRAVTAIWV